MKDKRSLFLMLVMVLLLIVKLKMLKKLLILLRNLRVRLNLYYDVIKSLHLVSVISWMVGLLYLPRLFVYHYDTNIRVT